MRAAVLLMAASTSLLGCDASPAAASRLTLTPNANPPPQGRTASTPAGPVTPSTPDTPIARSSNECAADMILAEGNYCPTPVQRCLKWLDKGHYRNWRCAQYEEPASCSGERRALRFCIDRDEYVAPGQSVPLTSRTMLDAERICKAANKRLCLESEWNFACEGEQMTPYPYGFERDAAACNADKQPVVGTDSTLVSLARPPGSFPRCTSPFGIRDMTGNVEEWVRSDRRSTRGVMKGSYWIPTRNNCRAGQRIHGPLYSGVELGFRCCADAAK
jgi:hypothetical protein